MGLLNFWSNSATDKTLKIGEKITDGITRGVDALIFTDEEKNQLRQHGAEILLDFWKSVSSENTQQSMARRELVKMTMQVFFTLLLVGVAVFKFDRVFADFIFSVAKEITWLVTLVAGIYFGPHQLSKIISK